MTIILINKAYTEESKIIGDYADKLTPLCHEIINNSAYKDVKAMSQMQLSFVVAVAGGWFNATISFELREYETMTIDGVTISTDTLIDYYGHDTLEEFMKEYGDEVRVLEDLTDEKIKSLIEIW